MHIHSPASFEWKGQAFAGASPADREKLLAAMVGALNDAPADAFAIVDYWTLEGWLALHEYTERNPGALTKRVFPGIELRIESPSTFRLNIQCIFDDELSPQLLREFVAHLKLTGVNRQPSEEAFAEVARENFASLRTVEGLSEADRTDSLKMARVGVKHAVISRESLQSAVNHLGDRVVVVQPWDTSDGLSSLNWQEHTAEATALLRQADFFETRRADSFSLFVGTGFPPKPDMAKTFFEALGECWKPVISGSDAHTFSEYGRFHHGKSCWIKADLSFEGLRRCLVDPAGRCALGEEPAKLKHARANPTKYLRNIRIAKIPGSEVAQNWFDADLPLNPGMIAIIGNKGSGKSALADILALAANSHGERFEFLNAERFRDPGQDVARHFQATLTWGDGSEDRVVLSEDSKPLSPERCRYLPQQYLEQLCAEPSDDSRYKFEDELKKVVFSHVPTSRRLGKSDLDSLLKYQTDQIEAQADAERVRLSILNRSIHSLEADLTPESISALEAALELRKSELKAHLELKPAVVLPPAEGPAEEAGSEAEIEKWRKISVAGNDRLMVLSGSAAQVESENAAIDRLERRLAILTADVAQLRSDTQQDDALQKVALQEILTFGVNREPLTKRRLELASLSEQVELERTTLTAELAIAQRKLEELQDKATEPQRKYLSFLEAESAWSAQESQIQGSDADPGSLVFLTNRLAFLTGKAREQLDELKAERWGLTEQIFQHLLSQRDVLKSLYGPVQSAAAAHEFLQGKLALGFNVLVDGTDFPDTLLSHLNQGRRGSFYGNEEGADRARRLVKSASLESWEGVREFIERVFSALTTDMREDRGEKTSLVAQLRDPEGAAELYDAIFGVRFLRPRLTLQLAGKEVVSLSPGERGILLLVFYLLLDKDEVPIIIDQPEHNLDNASVFGLLEPCIRRAKGIRQLVVVTHNANVAVVCDAEQVIHATIDKQAGNRVNYLAGSIENPALNLGAVNVLEGTWPAFATRDESYQRAPRRA